MIHILAHFIGDTLAGQVECDSGAGPDLRSERMTARGELRRKSISGAVIRLQDSFFLEVGDRAGDVRLVALAEVGKPRSRHLALVAVEDQQVQRMRAAQPVFLHLFRRDLIPILGYVKNIQRKMLKTVFHCGVLSVFWQMCMSKT